MMPAGTMTKEKHTMRHRHRATGMLCLGLLAFAALTSFARATDDKALYDAAKKEGEVVWYTSLIVNQAVRPLIEAFNKKYPGIEVKYSRADSGPNAIKVMNEARAGRVQGDVFDGIDTAPPFSRPISSTSSCRPRPTNIRRRCATPRAAGML